MFNLCLVRVAVAIEANGPAIDSANGDVVPAGQLGTAEQRIRELERALWRKTMEVEILQAARDEVKNKPRWYGVS